MNLPSIAFTAKGHKYSWAPKRNSTPETTGRNPVIWGEGEYPDSLAGHLFVGLNVGQSPRYTVRDVMRIVKRLRTEQTGVPNSTFILQKGIYKDQPSVDDPKDYGVVEEDSVQVVVFREDPKIETKPSFRAHMIEIGEKICRELRQRTVILDLKQNSTTIELMGITGK